MALYNRSVEKKRITHDFRRQEEEVIGSLCRLGSRPISPKTQLEQEKRIRREIANSNERRRMQSINAGFQSLRTLLPHNEGEKLSKAAILQHTAEYIYQLEQEKTRLLSQNCQLKRLVSSQMNHDSDGSCSDSPLPKRKKTEIVESSDEGIGSMSPSESEPGVDEVRREMIDLRVQLDRERRLRLVLEEQMRNLEAQLYPERIREIAHQVQLQYQQRNGEDPPKTVIPPVSMVLDTGIASPPSQLSSEEVESSHEMSVINASSPTHPPEVPQDLSGKSNSVLLPEENITEVVPTVPVDVAATTTTTTAVVVTAAEVVVPPVLTELTAAVPVPAEHPASETLTSQSTSLFPKSTSRQNLETIVEAIRHLEGDHLFRDDPEPLGRDFVQTTSQDRIIVKVEQSTELKSSPLHCVSGEFAIRHQIIQSAPVSQSRPGVIVTNHS